MRIYTVDEAKQQKDQIVRQMRSSVFIYPTDTLYGLGCNAMVHTAVDRVRHIKSRYERPFAVIAPSKEWIYEHCFVEGEAKDWVEQFPGPITLILPLKDVAIVDPAVLNGSTSLGVRIPKHWISSFVKELGYPVVLTSANHVGEPVMTSIDNLDNEIAHKTDFFIDEGELTGVSPKVMKFDKKGNRVQEP